MSFKGPNEANRGVSLPDFAVSKEPHDGFDNRCDNTDKTENHRDDAQAAATSFWRKGEDDSYHPEDERHSRKKQSADGTDVKTEDRCDERQDGYDAERCFV